MSRFRRIANVIVSILMIGASIALLFEPEDGMIIVAIALGFALLIYGVYKLVYYLTMARHMAGGLSILFVAVLTIDLGSLSLAFSSEPRLAIVLYLVGYNMFTGVIAIARAVESRLFGGHWKATLAHGLVNVALAIACLAFMGSDQIVIAIFCFGLFYNGCVRFVSALRPAEIIYIQ